MSRQGDNRERRTEIRRAHDEGRNPSAAGLTTGADKQQRSLKGKQAAKANAPMHDRNGKT